MYDHVQRRGNARAIVIGMKWAESEGATRGQGPFCANNVRRNGAVTIIHTYVRVHIYPPNACVQWSEGAAYGSFIHCQ